MLDRAILLLFLYFVMCSLSSPLYPTLRYSPLPISGKAVSFQLQESDPVQSHNLSVEEQEEENFLTSPAEKRILELEETSKAILSHPPVVQEYTIKAPPTDGHPASVWKAGLRPYLMQRHADAIFTDSYRKVRGKLSAQKLLQGIVGKRLGEDRLGDEDHEFLTRRHSDSILMDSRYHQQMVLRNFLGAMLQNQRLQDVNNNHLEDFVSVLAKLIEL